MGGVILHPAKFALGQLVFTSGVNNESQNDPAFTGFVWGSLNRHAQGDWGELDSEDKRANDHALKSGEDRLFSAYEKDGLPKIWIITEWNRSSTCALFPSEY